MVTIKTLKDRIKQKFPHLSNEEIENAKIVINKSVHPNNCNPIAITSYIYEDRLCEPKHNIQGEYSISIDINNL